MTSSDPPPADVIAALQIAEDRLQEAEETLSDGLSHALPADVPNQYREHKNDLWRYRNYLLDLRMFLEECEEAGVFESAGIDSVAEDWIHAPE